MINVTEIDGVILFTLPKEGRDQFGQSAKEEVADIVAGVIKRQGDRIYHLDMLERLGQLSFYGFLAGSQDDPVIDDIWQSVDLHNQGLKELAEQADA